MDKDMDTGWVVTSEMNSALILRADEMGNELRQLVTEKDEDRAAVLVTMDQPDGGGYAGGVWPGLHAGRAVPADVGQSADRSGTADDSGE